MTAAAADRSRKQHVWKHRTFTLTSGTKAFKGAACVLVLATGKVKPGVAGMGLMFLGVFDETIDATSAEKEVSVDLLREVVVEWFVNATSTNAVAATDVGKRAFFVDDQTVGILADNRTLAGRIWGVDTNKGVAVEKLDDAPEVHAVPIVGAFTANDYAPATLEADAIYDVPTTGAASTVTLPAAAPDGTVVHFAADGTKNGHTVQYRDATGPTNLTTALTALKRHLVVCAKRDGKWVANAYVSP